MTKKVKIDESSVKGVVVCSVKNKELQFERDTVSQFTMVKDSEHELSIVGYVPCENESCKKAIKDLAVSEHALSAELAHQLDQVHDLIAEVKELKASVKMYMRIINALLARAKSSGSHMLADYDD